MDLERPAEVLEARHPLECYEYLVSRLEDQRLRISVRTADVFVDGEGEGGGFFVGRNFPSLIVP